MGTNLDLSLRRHQAAHSKLLKLAMKRSKLKKTDIEKGLWRKRKNLEVDEMGDLRGRVHVRKQDLGKLQTRKMKGLKGGDVDREGYVEEADPDGFGDDGRKRRRKEA